MSRASARELRLAARSVKAARTSLSNANVLRELFDHDRDGYDSVQEHLKLALYRLEGMTARAATRAHHGADPAEWPEDLRVQEFPVVTR